MHRLLYKKGKEKAYLKPFFSTYLHIKFLPFLKMNYIRQS